MANFTKKAIVASFIKLLTERPLSQITVKDILRYEDIFSTNADKSSLVFHIGIA